MEAHLGEEYNALIISIQKFGCFVELFEVFVEGFFPSVLRRIRRRPLCLSRARSRHGRPIQSGRPPCGPGVRHGRGSKAKPMKWHLGDRVRVRAERIDPCENGSSSRWSAEIKEEFWVSADRRDRNVKRLVIFYRSGAATALDCTSDAPANLLF